MKTLRTLSASAALAIAATAGVNVYAAAPSTEPAKQVALQTPSELAYSLQQIRVDNIAGKTVVSLLARVDALVEQIDAFVLANPESAAELAELRKKALLVRAQLASGEATDLVMQDCVDCAPVADFAPAPMDGTIIGDPILGESIMGAPMMTGNGGFVSGGGGGGFAGGGGGGLLGGGGIGGFAAIGLGAAGLAVGLANDDNNNNPGPPASPSNSTDGDDSDD